jgi:hypothetical protein
VLKFFLIFFSVLIFALPASAEVVVATKSYVDSIVSIILADANLVHKTGDEIISGQKTFAGESEFNSDVRMNNELYVIGEIHAGDVNVRSGQQLTIDGGADFYISPAGYSSVPTPAGADNIANKAYVDSVIATKVGKTGDETISGNKTFSGSIIVPTQPTPAP